jgi:arylsulfatase A-like enzyme
MTRYLVMFLASCLASSLAAVERLPNIVILYSDDAGYADFGFQPNCVEEMRNLTPHIDTIARDGVRLSNGYMSGAVCSPSRAGLNTGRYQQRYGYDNNLPPKTQDGLPLNEVFAAKRLKELGYATGLVGKWHLGYPQKFHPNRRGYDWFYGLLQGARSYFPYKKAPADQVIQENGKATVEEGYVTDRFGDAACRFIKEHKKEPFYLYVSFTAPHAPNQPRKEDAERIAHISPKQRREHCGLIVALDDNVGKILKCLDEEGLDGNTLVIFTNDNGGATHTGANNTPLHGKKGQVWEGGIRVPWALRWPGKIKAGSVIDDPIISLDLLPTFIELAGAKVDPAWKLDGISLLPRLTGKTEELPTRPLFWRQGGSKGPRAMREGQWKIVHDRKSGSPPRLFDLSTDIEESEDLAAEKPEILKAMLAKLNSWESELQEPRWGAGSK